MHQANDGDDRTAGAPPLLILASRSPRRAELLAQMRIPFRTLEADVDETVLPGESAVACAARLAESKARRVLALTSGVLPVLGADTIVIRDGLMLGKPADRHEHLRMLGQLAGGVHQVVTGVCLVTPAAQFVDVVTTEVEFTDIDASTCEAYVRTGEGNDKAGGYGIQGLGGIFVKRLVGSYSAVVGLPLAETEALLRRSGLDTWQRRFHEF
jgi:septum formation protein